MQDKTIFEWTSLTAPGCDLPVAYYNAVIAIENHLSYVIGSHTACKRLVNVYKFGGHVY